MKPLISNTQWALPLLIAGLLAVGPVMAEKPAWAGAGKGGKNESIDRRDEQKGERRNDDEKSRGDKAGPAAGQRGHFDDQHRVIVREYYTEQFRGGRCPPGLAKKQNGCMPRDRRRNGSSGGRCRAT